MHCMFTLILIILKNNFLIYLKFLSFRDKPKLLINLQVIDLILVQLLNLDLALI